MVLLQNGWEALPVRSAFLTSSVVRAGVLLCDPLRSLQSVPSAGRVEHGDEPATPSHWAPFGLQFVCLLRTRGSQKGKVLRWTGQKVKFSVTGWFGIIKAF